MNQELANRLHPHGGIFVLENFPVGSEFGIDMQVWNVGEMFRGLKLIPPGFHFIYFSAVSKQGETAPRTGFFHYFKPSEVLLKKWDKFNEDISTDEIHAEEIENIQQNLREMDRFLGPFPFDSWKKWISLTNYITDETAKKLLPLSNRVSSVTEFEPCVAVFSRSKDRAPNSTKEEEDEPKRISRNPEDFLPNLHYKAGTEFRFSKFPEKKYPSGSSATEITKHSLDLTYTFQQLLSQHTNVEDILGELQLAFVCFLVAHVYDAFEHWKKLVEIMCSCDEAYQLYPDLFTKMIGVLYFQIQEVPKDFFVDIVSCNNFLTTTLQIFFSTLDSSDAIPETLKTRGRQFKAYLTNKFKWDFEIEPDDCAPVIVET